MRHCTIEEIEMLHAGELDTVTGYLRRRHAAKSPACAAMLKQIEADEALLKEALEAVRKEAKELPAVTRVTDSLALHFNRQE